MIPKMNKMIRFLFGIAFLFIIPLITCAQKDTLHSAQKDIVDVYKNVHMRFGYPAKERIINDTSKLFFSFTPPVASSSNKGFVTSFMAAFYLGDKKTTTMSNIYFTPYFTFSNQYVLPVRSYVWTKNNAFNFTGDYRFMKYPQPFYELGPNSSDQEQVLIDYYQIRFYQNGSIKIVDHLAAGVGIQVDYYYNIHEEEKYIDGPTDWETYEDTSRTSYVSSGSTFDLIYDSRKNTINPENGWYGRVTFRDNLTEYGSTQKWSSIYMDGRTYFSLSKKRHSVIALWGLYWTVLGGTAPYLDLPSIGWDFYGHTGRGIKRNRFKSTGILYGEVEYRRDITKNGLWGAVLFVNATAPSVMNTQSYKRFYGAIGTGVRLKFDKRTASNLLFDVGFSKNYWTWYIGLNEYF